MLSIDLYIAIVKHNYANSPEYDLYCEVFTDEKEAYKYKQEKENEYPFRWGGENNMVKIIKKTIHI